MTTVLLTSMAFQKDGIGKLRGKLETANEYFWKMKIKIKVNIQVINRNFARTKTNIYIHCQSQRGNY